VTPVQSIQDVLRDLLDLLTDPGSLKDQTGRYLHVNRAAAQVLGLGPEQVVGRTDLQFGDDVCAGEVMAADRRVIDRGEPETQVVRSAGGEGVPVLRIIRRPFRDVEGRVLLLTVSKELTRVRRPIQEPFFRAAIDGALDAMVIADDVGTYIEANKSAEVLFGVGPGGLVGRSVSEFSVTVGKISEPWAAFRRGALSSGLVWLTRADGTRRLAEFSATLDMVPGLHLSVLRDVTDRYAEQEELRRQKEVFEKIFEQSPVMIALTDLEAQVSLVNPSVVKTLGWSREELQQNDFMPALHPDPVMREHAESFRRDPPEGWYDFDLRTRDGRVLHTSWAGVRLSDGKVLWLGQDITDRLRTEKALRRSEADYRLLAENSSDVIIRLDAFGRILYVSPAVRDQLGHEPSGLIGTVFLNLIHPDDHGTVAGAIAGTFSDLAPRTIEVRRLHRNGSALWVESIWRALDGGTPEVLCSARDVTVRKEAEERLRVEAERREHLRAIHQAILTVHTPREIGGAALGHLLLATGSRWGGVALVNLENAEAMTVAAEGPPLGPLAPARWPLHDAGEALTAACRTGATLQVGGQQLARSAFDPLRRAGLQTIAVLPFKSAGEPLGFLYIGTDGREEYDAEVLTVAREVADQVAVAIHSDRLFDEVVTGRERLRALSARLFRAQEDERRRIARELHDEVGQSLSALKILLQSETRARRPGADCSRVQDGIALVERVLGQVRGMSLNLRPSLLDDFGLIPALRSHVLSLSKRTGLRMELRDDPKLGRPHPEVETACYRVAQEALTNTVRHSGATQVDVTLSRVRDEILLSVADNGRGFDVEAALDRASAGISLGLLGMRERATLIGGRLKIHSGPGQGTEVRASFPVAPDLTEDD